MEIFTQPNEVDPMDITDDETTPAENYQDNGASTSHGIQPSLPHSPLKDALVTSEPPLLRPNIDFGNAARLASTDDHPKVHLRAADNAPFSVF